MKNEKMIAGKTETEIRAAYYKKKLPQLLTEISAEGEPDEKELIALAEFLDTLQKEEAKTLATLKKNAPDVAIGNEAMIVPTIDTSRTPDEQKSFDAFFAEAEKSTQLARRIMFGVYQNIQNKVKMDSEYYLDAALEIAGLLHFIDGYRVYKDQEYRQELTRIIRDAGCSRKEAEEWAKTGNQYAEYKRAVLFKEQIEEFIMLCKKKSGGEF